MNTISHSKTLFLLKEERRRKERQTNMADA